MEDNINFLKTLDNLNVLAKGRRPQYFGKWKMKEMFGTAQPQLVLFFQAQLQLAISVKIELS